MADTPANQPKLILANELFGIRLWLRMRCAIGITFQRNRGHRNFRELGQLFFQCGVFRFTICQIQTPAIVVDRGGDRSGLSKAGALRSKVASSKVHFGEASCQIILSKS